VYEIINKPGKDKTHQSEPNEVPVDGIMIDVRLKGQVGSESNPEKPKDEQPNDYFLTGFCQKDQFTGFGENPDRKKQKALNLNFNEPQTLLQLVVRPEVNQQNQVGEFKNAGQDVGDGKKQKVDQKEPNKPKLIWNRGCQPDKKPLVKGSFLEAVIIEKRP